MKKFKLLSFLLIICLFPGMLSVPALAPDDPAVSAQSVVLMDAGTGDILYQSNPDAAFAPGALNVLMTALVLDASLSSHDVRLDDAITQSAEWRYNTTDASRLAGYTDGDSFSVEGLLYMSALISSEDTANAIALHVSGSGSAFADAMNRRAQELGCTGSNFVNAGGTYAPGQYTTAHDMALIARAVLRNSQVMSAFESVEYSVAPTASYTTDWKITTDNALMKSGDERYLEYVYAGKTSSSGGGNSLVAAANNNGMDLIAVVAGCPEGTDVFSQTKGLFEWAFSNFSLRSLISASDTLTTIPVAMGSPDSVGVRAETGISLILPNERETGNVRYEVQYEHELEGRTLQAPLNAGEVLGSVTVYLDGESCGSVRLVAASQVEISRMEYLRTELSGMFKTPAIRQIITILVVLLAVYLLLTVFYFVQRFRHLHSLRVAKKDRAIAQAQREAQWIDDPDDEDDGYDGPAGYIDQSGGDGYDDEEDYDDEPAPGPDTADEDYFDSYFKG